MSGQDKEFEPKIMLGPSFGVTLSSVSFVPKVRTNLKQGYTGGLAFRWETEKNLGLQGEINYTQQGWDEKFEETPQYYYRRTLNYVEIPFLTHIYFGSDRFKFFVNLGPKIGLNIGESTSDNLDGEEVISITSQHDMTVEKKFDWGLCGGPGLELRTGIGYFILEGRYYYALGDVFKSRKEDFFSKSSSQVISAKITYLLPINLAKKNKH
jgi:hypothetical protein